MLEALRKLYESDIALAKANIQVYLDNPAGIGEHPTLVQAVDSQISLIAAAEDKLNVLSDHYDIEVEEEDEEEEAEEEEEEEEEEDEEEEETPEYTYLDKSITEGAV